MDQIELVLRVLLVVNAVALIGLVLLQQGRGASMGAAFGSGASQTLFGSAGATSFLTKLTAWLAVAFFAITFSLAWAARERAEAAGTVGIPESSAGEERSAPEPGEVPSSGAPAREGAPAGPDASAPPRGEVPRPSEGERSSQGGGSAGEVPQP